MNPEISSANNSIYGNHLADMELARDEMLRRIYTIRQKIKTQKKTDPIEHCLSRIKSEESIREKCRRKKLPETTESALYHIHDAIGIRIVCAFLDDVYTIRDDLIEFADYELVTQKDYIHHAKPNGYRSLHLILKVPSGYFMELQLRTISMDTWAALEHHLKYKKTLSGNETLIVKELKRLADELASTDVSMQTIRNMIFEESATSLEMR